MTGSVEAGLATFDEGLEAQRAIGTEENLSAYLDMRAEILERAGRLEEALALLRQTIDACTEAGQLFWLPELYRRRALLMARLGGGPDQVQADLQQALALAESQGALTLAERARNEIARLAG
jgi:predicted ATPase